MAKETTLKEIGEMLSFVVEHMATKEDIADVRRDMATKDEVRDIVREEVRDIVREEVKKTMEEMDIATKEDIKGIVSTAHNRIDQEVTHRKQLEVRVTRLEQGQVA